MKKPYDSKRRSEAATKAWAKRKADHDELVRLALPDYDTIGDQPKVPAPLADNVDIGIELPFTRDALAGGIADWEDDVFDVDPNGYRLMRNCPAVQAVIRKLGIRTAGLDLVVVGEGARAEALQEIIDQAEGKQEMVEWNTWAQIEGVRYIQIKQKASREGGPIWVVPTFIGGGRKKQKAGGDLQWDGTRIMSVQKTTGVTHRAPEELPREQFMICRPGCGSNPEGDLELGVSAYRLAFDWNEVRKSQGKYTELFAVPMRIIQRKLDSMRPDQIRGFLSASVEQLQLQQNDRAIGLSQDDIIKLLQPQGRPLLDMTDYKKSIETALSVLILLNALTSDTADSGPAGSSTVHLSEENDAVRHNAHIVLQPLNRDLLPWIYQHNPDLPELAQGESAPFLEMQPMGNRESDKTAIPDEVDIVDVDAPIDELAQAEPGLEPEIEAPLELEEI